jgi:hypothetical protein
MGHRVDPSLFPEKTDRATHRLPGDTVLPHQSAFAWYGASGFEITASDAADQALGNHLVERCSLRFTPGLTGRADERALALCRMDETLVPEHSDRSPGSRPGDAELAPQLGLTRYGVAESEPTCQDAPPNGVGYLNVQMGVALVIQHSHTVTERQVTEW